MKPKIAISIGDPGGIGPEIVLKSLLKSSVARHANIVVVGNVEILRRAARPSHLPIRFVSSGLRLPDGGIVSLKNIPSPSSRFRLGKASRINGEIAGKCIEEAIHMALSHEVDGIVTAPVSKESLAMAGYGMVGHTEILARMTGTTSYAMMLARAKMRVVFATGHVAIREVCRHLRKDELTQRIKLAARYIDLYMGIAKPRIGVACLNPHCGEGGLLGVEERKIIAPAVRSAKKMGIDVEGPFPSDYLFSENVWKNYDCIVAMYHDQGMIPLRARGFANVVNITLGIPIVRTSPGHGTAFEIAGKGMASEKSMVCAMIECAKIIKRLRNAG